MKMLLLRTDDKIGDSVVETCFYRELKRFFPQAHLTVMMCGCRPILQTVPYIDKFIWLRAHGMGRFIDAFCALPYIWLQKYDVLVSLTPTRAMQIFNHFVRAKRKIPFAYTRGLPAVCAYERVFKQLGIEQIDTSYELRIPAKAQQAARDFLEKNSLAGKPFLFFNPAGGSIYKTLTVEKTAEILDSFPPELPIVLCNYKDAYPIYRKGVVLWNSRDILQTAALIQQSDYVLTVDTGISHIASVFDKPISVLFSLKSYDYEPAIQSSLLNTWIPRGSCVQVLWGESSVNEISPEEILNTLRKNWTRKK